MKAPTLPAPVDECGGDPAGTPFVLHDGPPYANGRLHMGHALNRLLKDMVLRDRRRRGFLAPLLPNSDCHGLPLENRFAGRRTEFADRRDYLDALGTEASSWASAQAEGMRSLGVAFRDADRTLSCEPRAQALVMRQFHRLVQAGLVYRRARPTSWSPMDMTVLADAETVDVEREVDDCVVAFPLSLPLHDGPAALAVWTTTPWSLPGNVGVAWNPDASYGLYDADGRSLVCSDEGAALLLPNAMRLRDVSCDELGDVMPKHPLHAHGYPLTGRDSALITADFVDASKGTGFVHLGPAHSQEDWEAWKGSFPDVVGEDGCYASDVPLFAGLTVVEGGGLGKADEAVLLALGAEGTLVSRGRRTMTLKKSWRSEGLLVVRSTQQWFVDLSKARERAVEAVETDEVVMVPASSKQRFLSMLRSRPDWLVSRQREWGVPLGLFVDRRTGMPLDDPRMLAAASGLVEAGGLATWWEATDEEVFAAAGRSDHADFDRVRDVLDVWFDSACVQDYGQGVADLVVEGTDQHRGWFSSSLLKACALGDPLPFRTVLTHGFVVDETRTKMSKSSGNGTSPEEAVAKHGPDVVRLWAALVDATADVPFSDQLLDEARRTRDKLRNALRYLTGVLRDWSQKDAQAMVDDPHDLLLLSETAMLVRECDDAGDALDFRRQLELVRDFVDQRLSAHHVDVRKDLLYCRSGTPAWHASRSVLMRTYGVLLGLLRTFAPTMVEELSAVMDPTEDCVVLPSRPDTALRGLLAAADVRVSEMLADGTLKRSDAGVVLGTDHAVLMASAPSDHVARWLKVDRLESGDADSVRTVEEPTCPRCRLHGGPGPNGWCPPCEEHVDSHPPDVRVG
jgi:isoleucyl-tRNA synthetase